eukprot:gene16329-11668_t
MPGSKQVLTDFLGGTDLWLEATNSLCGALGVSIVDYSNTAEDLSAWLGTGANGRVFRLANDQVIKVVVGRRSEEIHIAAEKSKVLRMVVTCLHKLDKSCLVQLLTS